MAQSEPIARPQSRSAAGTAEARILLPRGHNSTGGVAAVLLSTWSAQHKPRHPIDVPCRRPKGVDRPNVLAARSDEMPGLPLLKNALEILCLSPAGSECLYLFPSGGCVVSGVSCTVVPEAALLAR